MQVGLEGTQWTTQVGAGGTWLNSVTTAESSGLAAIAGQDKSLDGKYATGEKTYALKYVTGQSDNEIAARAAEIAYGILEDAALSQRKSREDNGDDPADIEAEYNASIATAAAARDAALATAKLDWETTQADAELERTVTQRDADLDWQKKGDQSKQPVCQGIRCRYRIAGQYARQFGPRISAGATTAAAVSMKNALAGF